MAKQQQPQQTEKPRKIGEGMLQAAWRQGGQEFTDNVIPAFPEHARTNSEPGTMFNTPITGISQQTGFAQPVKSAVDMHHQEMVGNTEPSKEQTREVTAPEQRAEVSQPSIIDQHHSEMQQQHELQQPQMEIDK